jgi:hypothetical protein
VRAPVAWASRCIMPEIDMDQILTHEQVRALRKMSLGQRIALNASLWDHANALKQEALRTLHPDLSEEQVREAAREVIQSAAG